VLLNFCSGLIFEKIISNILI